MAELIVVPNQPPTKKDALEEDLQERTETAEIEDEFYKVKTLSAKLFNIMLNEKTRKYDKFNLPPGD